MESHFCRKCWRWVILAWALFYLWEAKMLKTEENNCKESKWKLVLISSLNVLQPGTRPFSGCGDNTICHQKSVAPLCVMFPYRGCAWEPLRPSWWVSAAAGPGQHALVTAEESSPTLPTAPVSVAWLGAAGCCTALCPTSHMVIFNPDWHLDSYHVTSCFCQQKRAVELTPALVKAASLQPSSPWVAHLNLPCTVP